MKRHHLFAALTLLCAAGCSSDNNSTTDDGAGGSGGTDPEVNVRIGQLTPDSRQLDVCVRGPSDTDFRGPLLGDSNQLATAAVSVPIALPATTSTEIRWIEGSSTDCTTPLDGEADAMIDLSVDNPEYVLRMHTQSDANSAIETRVLTGHAITEINPRRFYSRFFHAGRELGQLKLTQNDCAILFSAFEAVEYGTLGFAPNNQAEFFSASVSIGLDHFETTVVICTSEGTEVVRLPGFRFNGGEVALSAIVQAPPPATGYVVARCVEGTSTPCEILP